MVCMELHATRVPGADAKESSSISKMPLRLSPLGIGRRDMKNDWFRLNTLSSDGALA